MTSVLRFGVISDAHIAPPGSPPFRWHDWYRLEGSLGRFVRAIAWCLSAGVDALLIPGDVTHGGDRASLDAMVDALAVSGRSAWVAGGNHDTLAGPDLLEQALAGAADGTARGVRPGGERFRGLVIAGGHARPVAVADTAGVRRYRTEVPALDATDGPVVWMSHFPTLATTARLEAHGIAHARDALDREEIAESLTRRAAPTIAVAGHLHVRDAITDGRVLQVSSAALVEPPCEASVLEVAVDGDSVQLRTRCHSLDAMPDDAVLPVLVEASTAWRYTPGGGWLRLHGAAVRVAEG